MMYANLFELRGGIFYREKCSNMKKKILFSLLLVSLAFDFSYDKGTSVSTGPDTSILDDAFTSAAQIPNIKNLVVFKGYKIIRERYFDGGDLTSMHNVRSVTKSVMATLIGIAIDKGYIRSEDETIGNYLARRVNSVDSVKANIKIRDLLSMSSGISGNELANLSEYDSWLNAPDQVNYTLGKSMAHQPGQVFSYNSGAAHLTSAILTQARGYPPLGLRSNTSFSPSVSESIFGKLTSGGSTTAAPVCTSLHTT